MRLVSWSSRLVLCPIQSLGAARLVRPSQRPDIREPLSSAGMYVCSPAVWIKTQVALSLQDSTPQSLSHRPVPRLVSICLYQSLIENFGDVYAHLVLNVPQRSDDMRKACNLQYTRDVYPFVGELRVLDFCS